MGGKLHEGSGVCYLVKFFRDPLILEQELANFIFKGIVNKYFSPCQT